MRPTTQPISTLEPGVMALLTAGGIVDVVAVKPALEEVKVEEFSSVVAEVVSTTLVVTGVVPTVLTVSVPKVGTAGVRVGIAVAVSVSTEVTDSGGTTVVVKVAGVSDGVAVSVVVSKVVVVSRVVVTETGGP